MISLEIHTKPDSKWNERLSSSPLGTIYHAKEYASAMESLNYKPIFIKFNSPKGDIIAQMLVVINSRFYNKTKLSSFLGKILYSKDKICSWVFGPIIFDFNYKNDICNLLQNFLISNSYLVSGSEHPLSEKSLSYLRPPITIKEWGTFLLDLSKNIEEQWNKLDKHSARKNIERAQKRGVYIKEIKRSDLEFYCKVREDTKPVLLSVLEKRWDLLNEIGWIGFLAYENEIQKMD